MCWCCSLGTVNYTWRGPLAAGRGPWGATGGAGGTGETDYGGLGAPIDGQMNQQGPLSFIHSPSGPLHRSSTWGPLTLGQDCIIYYGYFCVEHFVEIIVIIVKHTKLKVQSVSKVWHRWGSQTWEDMDLYMNNSCASYRRCNILLYGLMRSVCVCVSRGDNPVSRLQGPTKPLHSLWSSFGWQFNFP